MSRLRIHDNRMMQFHSIGYSDIKIALCSGVDRITVYRWRKINSLKGHNRKYIKKETS